MARSLADKLLRLIARQQECAYRRGYQQGWERARNPENYPRHRPATDTQVGEWRRSSRQLTPDYDESPTPPGHPPVRMTAVQRLEAELVGDSISRDLLDELRHILS